MTSAPEHLPPEYSVSTGWCLLEPRGLEEDCIMHCRSYRSIRCLWNSTFVPCAFERERERGLLLHTPTFPARPWADGSETFSPFLSFTHRRFFVEGRDRLHSGEIPRLRRLRRSGRRRFMRLLLTLLFATEAPRKILFASLKAFFIVGAGREEGK